MWVMLGASTTEQLAANLDRYRIIGAGDNHLTVRAIKRYMDGALGSRGRVAAGAVHRQTG